MDKKNYITPLGHKKLLDELNHLLKIERPEVTKLVQWAASNGDRSENADYLYGKRRLREIDRRLRFLNQRLEDALVIDPTKINSDRVQFGATVVVVDDEENEKKYSIVGVDEVNTDRGKISWQSPIGKALLGKISNDEIIVKTPVKEIILTIVAIEYIEIIDD